MPPSHGQMEDSDVAAVTRVRAGDRDSFRALVERHSRHVFRLAFRITGNEADAEDVVQETFLRAFRELARYETRSSFGTWVYRIATNYALDLVRSKRWKVERQPEMDSDGADPFERIGSGSPGQERLLLSAEVSRRFQHALAELSVQERTAFEMRHFEGLSISEIGSILSLGESATKNSIFRAVKKLRVALEPLAGQVQGAEQS